MAWKYHSFATRLKQFIVTLCVSLVSSTGFAQQTCPQIPPPDLRAIDKPFVVYDLYIKPIQKSLSIGRAIVLPTDLAGKAKLLTELQEGYLHYDDATVIELVSTIKMLSTAGGTAALNTGVVLDTLKLQKNDAVAKQLSRTAMCAGQSPLSPGIFDISFYALNKEACNKMLRLFTLPTSPREVRVNNNIKGVCLPDGSGSNSARNQITFTYLAQS